VGQPSKKKLHERINALKQSKNVKVNTINQCKRIGSQNTKEIILKK